MRLSPDEIVFWQFGFVRLNATIVFTWALMLLLVLGVALLRLFSLIGATGSFFWLVLAHTVIVTPYVMRLVVAAAAGSAGRGILVEGGSYLAAGVPRPCRRYVWKLRR